MLRNVLTVLAVALGLLPWCGCKPKSDAKYKIAVIPKGQTHEFWKSIERGGRAAVGDLAAEAEKRKGAEAPTIINDSVYAGATVDTAQRNAVSLLNLVKDKADGIFAVNESATNGLLNEMRSRELNKKILLMGFDSSGPLLA